MDTQQRFWNEWNSSTRERDVARVSLDQADVIESWLAARGRRDLDIIDVGCGAAWLEPRLSPFGRVTATDLSDEVLSRAKTRMPEVRFVAGDFMALEFGKSAFDAIVTLEVLSHVADQHAFIAKLHGMLRPGGQLMLATQNRPALQRNDIPQPKPGQLRRWVDRHELRALLEPSFVVEELFSLTPQYNRGFLRLQHSHKLGRLVSMLRLQRAWRRFEKLEERAWLGWTLMVRATKRA
jgi:2-polyprenyl-3-methyl-5-hydroxy-6-metoxy-1,4-benzoquinol methylase